MNQNGARAPTVDQQRRMTFALHGQRLRSGRRLGRPAVLQRCLLAHAGGGAAGRRHLVETLDVCSLAYCHDALMASPDGMDIGGYQQESGFLPLFEAIRRERVRREGARGTQGTDPFGPASASEMQERSMGSRSTSGSTDLR